MPNPPVLVSVTVHTTSVTIIWNPPLEIEQNGPITTYHIYYNDSIQNAVTSFLDYQVPTPIIYPADSSVSISITFPVQLCGDLYTYTWYVTAENGAGISTDSNTISEIVFSNILTDTNIYTISGVSTGFGLLLFCCILLLLVHCFIFLMFCCRRCDDRKMKKLEVITVEMKNKTIFSNRSSLKEVEENEATKEPVYALLDKNQFPGDRTGGYVSQEFGLHRTETSLVAEGGKSMLERELSPIDERDPNRVISEDQPKSVTSPI